MDINPLTPNDIQRFEDDSELIPVVGDRGDGKTIGALSYAYCGIDLELKLKKEGKLNRQISLIVSNIDINLPNAIYSPFLLMPFSEIQSRHKFIIVDDIKSLRNIDGFLTFIGSISRKTNSSVIITAQYEKQIPKELREQTQFDMCRFSLDKESDVMIYEIKYSDTKRVTEYYYFEDCIKRVGRLYHSEQINELPEDSALETELIYQSPTKFDLRKNATILYRDKKERKSQIRRIEENFAYLRKKALAEREKVFPRFFK
jgi:hypothetical protein